LNPEQAAEALKSLRVENAAWRAAAAERLPAGSQAIGRILLGLERQPANAHAYDWVANARQLAAHLDQATGAERQQFLAALFPRLAPLLEQAWELSIQLPYQFLWHRKAFRAPHAPEPSLGARGWWLENLTNRLAGYDPDITWLAAWAPHLDYSVDDLVGRLLAAAIDAGGPEGEAVFATLVASAHGEHAIGGMGRHVTRALLTASRPDGWECIEKLLLAAQREEGLRQVILESVDEAHPMAFRRMLRLILDHDLSRFSATVRALDVWLGFQWDSVSVRVVNTTLQRLLQFLEDPPAREAALDSSDAETTYLALWALAFEDAVSAVPRAAQLLADRDVEQRFVAAHLLTQLGLVDAQTALLPALEDVDLRVVTRALLALRGADKELGDSDLFERLERVLPRFPRGKRTLDPLVWPWLAPPVDRSLVGSALVHNLGARSPTRLIRHMPLLTPDDRRGVTVKLAGTEPWDAKTRDTLLALIGDPAYQVRECALAAVSRGRVDEAEAPRLEGYLARKAGDLRRGVLALLLNQPDAAALASARRLLAASSAPQRLGGLEMLREMVAVERLPLLCRETAAAYRDGRPRLEEDETRQLEAIFGAERKVATLDDALGLVDPAARTQPDAPVRRPVSFAMTAATACLTALDDLVHAHRETPITLQTWQGPREELLGNVESGFPGPLQRMGRAQDAAPLPLRELWERWWRDRPAEARDLDGLELLRARASCPSYAFWVRGEPKPWQKRCSPPMRPAAPPMPISSTTCWGRPRHDVGAAASTTCDR
jgi:hypothetical protein